MNSRRDDSQDSPRKAWIRALERTASIPEGPGGTLPVVVDSLVERFGEAPALLSEHQTLTYRELATRSREYSKWALRHGLAFGDVVCLLMENCPEYLAIWLGLTRVGVIVSLLNTSLTGNALLYAIDVARPRYVIASGELTDTLDRIAPRLRADIQIWSHGENDHLYSRIDVEIQNSDSIDIGQYDFRRPTIHDRALYIYTSGTTGLPKAANVSHFRLLQWSNWFAGMMDVVPDDRIYNCLPMYHSIGGVVAVGSALVSGGSVYLPKRFSASRFWDNIVDSKCTMFQYIGELCRYLVNSPPSPREREHKLRLICGNGLNAHVWEEFQRRFRIPKILEFYASTEGNLSLFNCEGRVGSIGRLPSFSTQRMSTALVKLDVETCEPIRGQDGRCIPCSTNEAGEAIAKISNDRKTGPGTFEGYTDEAASEKKVLRDVFASGDVWFRTGDLMRKNDQGFFYFVDRIGDTFRWKGENVSTTEVAAVISEFKGVQNAVVYGVSVPGTEGRAGMLAASIDENFDMAAFREYLAERLPEYARPLFIRVVKEIDATETFKLKKQNLISEGYDPGNITDPIYFSDRIRGKFIRLDADTYRRIESGKMRL